MAHMALYRKWRPLSFGDVVEQRHIVETLKNSVKSNSISHAYLFCGTRGTGKTTMAKILARAINCLNPVNGSPCNECDICKGIIDGSVMDVIEIDAASNNGVDDVRQIKDAVMYVPAVARFKVYIIDEVHMLSTGAFNALLKTLEEPPESVVFILATTEPHRLPATILSRCQRFDFKRISVSGLAGRLRIIADSAGIVYEDAALNLIARLAEGGMRDAISLLDQCISSGIKTVTRNDVVEVSGYTALATIDKLAAALADRNIPEALMLIDRVLMDGHDLVPLCSQLIDWFRNLMLYQTGGEALKLIETDEEEIAVLKDSAGKMSSEETVAMIRELSEAELRIKWSENQRILMEATAVRICARSIDSSDQVERLMLAEKRLADLEKRIAGIGLEALYAKAKPAGFTDGKKNDITEVNSHNQEGQRHGETVLQKSTGTTMTVGKELRDWPDVIDSVRLAGKMKIYAYLLGTKCLLADESTAVVIVGRDESQKKTTLNRKESIEAISEALHTALNLDVKVKVKDEIESGLAWDDSGEDPVLERVKRFAEDHNINLNIRE